MNELIIDISGTTHTYRFPDSFQNFTRRHLRILNRYLDSKSDKLAYYKFITAFINIPRKVWKHLTGEELFWAEYTEEKGIVFLAELSYLAKPYENSKSLMPQIGIWRGPLNGLSNISLEQMGFASTFANAYADKEDGEMLNLFFASLYRLPFIPFSKRLITFYKYISKPISHSTKKAALLNFRGMLMANRKTYPHVYAKGSSDGTERFAWEGTIQKLAKTGVFGSYREAKKAKFPQAMILFEMNGIEVKRMNDQMKKQK